MLKLMATEPFTPVMDRAAVAVRRSAAGCWTRVDPDNRTRAKASAIARVVSGFDAGKGPDVLVLTEVESEAALEAVRDALGVGPGTL